MSLFPIFVKLERRPCLIVGAGNVALEKITSLLRAGRRVARGRSGGMRCGSHAGGRGQDCAGAAQVP